MASTQVTVAKHFDLLQALLNKLGLQEAKHKSTSPSQVMVWMGLRFDSLAMTVILKPEKLEGAMTLVGNW